MKNNPEQFLESLGFNIIESLGDGHFARCFRINKEGIYYTAKTILPIPSSVTNSDTYTQETLRYSQKIEHILKEYNALSLANDIQGIPNIKDFYRQFGDTRSAIKNFFFGNGIIRDQEIAIIKQYIPGRTMYLDEKLKGQQSLSLQNTVTDLHSKGIAGFTLKPENVILKKDNGIDGKPYIIDLGYAEIFKDKTSIKFYHAKNEDIESLNYLLEYN